MARRPTSLAPQYGLARPGTFRASRRVGPVVCWASGRVGGSAPSRALVSQGGARAGAPGARFGRSGRSMTGLGLGHWSASGFVGSVPRSTVEPAPCPFRRGRTLGYACAMTTAPAPGVLEGPYLYEPLQRTREVRAALAALEPTVSDDERARLRAVLASAEEDYCAAALVWLRRYVRSRYGGRSGIDEVAADEVIQRSLIQVHENLSQCRAVAERQARTWLFKVAHNKFVDWTREQARKRERVKRHGEEAEANQADSQTRAAPPRAHFKQALWLAREGAVALVATGNPRQLRQAARRAEIAARPERVERDLRVWYDRRVLKRSPEEIARREDAWPTDGSDLSRARARARNKISKQAERGAKALHFGALRALDDLEGALDPLLAEALGYLVEIFAPEEC